ncbi:hypothetical protein QQ045_030167 [Rhodiola kirilowii]
MQKPTIHQYKNDGGAFVQIRFHTKLLQLDLTGEDLAEIHYGNTSSTIPEPNTSCPDLDSEEESRSHAAFPEMFPEFASPADFLDSSNYGEHQTENFDANRFFNLLNSSSEPAYKGCTTETELSINMKMLATKTNYGLSEGAFNDVCGTMRNLIGGRIKSHLRSDSQKNS